MTVERVREIQQQLIDIQVEYEILKENDESESE